MQKKDDESITKDEKPMPEVEIETKAFVKLPIQKKSDTEGDVKEESEDDDEEGKLKLLVPKGTHPPLQANLPNEIMWAIPFPWEVNDLLGLKGWDLQDCTYLSLSDFKNPTLCNAIIKASVSDTVGCSIEVSVKRETRAWSGRMISGSEKKKSKNKCELGIGLGLHELTYTPDGCEGKSEDILAYYSNIGEPQTDQYGMSQERVLVLFVKGKNRTKFFKDFCTYVYGKSRAQRDNLLTIYRWFTKRLYWRKVGSKVPRKMESVVLPQKTKDLVNQDIKNFLRKETEEFYFKHGIPYKRNYLFRGVPGSGKTSLIDALAGVHKRNLCQMTLSVPNMTDEMFADCLTNTPADSIVVLEDVDSLFDAGRNKNNKDCPLTFSAVLNGLDGVASPYAQIFIMTTNHPNRLDPALVRSGRVDVHIEFKNATRTQMEGIFLNFYPDAGELAKEFADTVSELSRGTLSMASLQQHFIRHMSDSAKETITAVGEIMDCSFLESQSCAAKPGSVYN